MDGSSQVRAFTDPPWQNAKPLAGPSTPSMAGEFQRVVARVQQQIEDPKALAALHNAFLAHQPAEGFNAKSLNTAAHSTPIMQLIQESQRQISTEQLEEHLNARGENYITQFDLVHHFQKSLQTNAETIRHKMLELGWHKATVKWGGVDYARVIWLRPGYSAQRGQIVGPDGSRQSIRDEVEIDV